MSFWFNPRKLVPTKIKPSTVYYGGQQVSYDDHRSTGATMADIYNHEGVGCKNAKVPYLYYSDQWVSYDDLQSTAAKVG